MANVELRKRWMVSRTVLERARRALPDGCEQQYETQVARYREFLEHSEFELALDALEEIGHLVACRGGCWRDLERAAENMGLVEKLPALRKSFLDALK
jgi:hypothetical protein